ncbi:MAG: chemotaxis protein CheA [Gammaproteobacteria bacterium]
MSVDISQFHQIFFEESFEGLEIMESGLLALEPGEPDLEAINTIFRAAHSIKGGSGTFGFSAISSFTHVQETLLDEMRAGKRLVTRDAVDVLLRGVDGLRAMLNAARDGGSVDEEAIAETRRELDRLLNGAEAAPASTEAVPDIAAASPDAPWQLRFVPEEHLFKTGNDPVRILRELNALAPCVATPDLTRLPDLESLDPEGCYLGWTLEVPGHLPEHQVREVFEWVDNDAEITLIRAAPSAPEVVAEQSTLQPAGTALVDPVPATPAAGAPAAAGDRRQAAPASQNSSIRVDIEKVDALINMVGELVITQSMLSQFTTEFDMRAIEKLREGLLQLERNTRELQESVMSIRMMPIGVSFNRFPRLVRDLSSKLGKQVELKLTGEQTELDKTVLEKIGDPLVHLVRNALDHGIETPDVRVAAGKPASGTLELAAYHEGGNIVIEIIDDGAGLNGERILAKARARGIVGAEEVLTTEQVHDLIFAPGFSTADVVSDVSGRGVGMDVVRRNIKDLGGVVEIESTAGKGSVFRIRLPLTLAILDGQLVCVGEQIYIVPIVSIVESLQVQPAALNSVTGQHQVYRLRDEYIPIVRLHEVFNVNARAAEITDGLLVIVEGDGRKIGLFVDELLGQQQVVIKSLQTNFRRVAGVSGATILGDGKVAMIVDIGGLIQLSQLTPRAGSSWQPRLVA